MTSDDSIGLRFHLRDGDQPHPARTKAILAAHPEVRELFGRNPWTAAVLVALVVLQTTIAAALCSAGDARWWLVPLVAWTVGAFANHMLYVVIHEASHDLVFAGRTANRIVGIIADLPNVIPASTGFRLYHRAHHAHQGDYGLDADLPSGWEARLVGNRTWAKIIWLALYPLMQTLRPARIRAISLWTPWTFLGGVVSLVYATTLVLVFGWTSIVYLIASLFFSIGLHPLGGRWVQEHFTLDGKQETASYYGPLNRLALNVGYHVEHHDFPAIPWNRLPELRRIAPGYYDTLTHYDSLSRLFVAFLFDRRYSPYSRTVGRASLASAVSGIS